MDNIISFLREYPQIVVFLAIAIGYYIGKVKIFSFNLGSTAGVLIAALVLGQMDIPVSPLLKAVGFALFIFAIGYKVGPQFFGSLKKQGIKYIWLSIFVSFVGLFTAIILSKLFGFDKGITAGLLGGSMTQSSIIGTADGAIRNLTGVTDAAKATFESNVAVAYAVTYVFGTAGLIVFFKIVPKLMGINMKEASKVLEQKLSGKSDDIEDQPELFTWFKRINLRAYQVTNQNIVGKSTTELEAMFTGRVAVAKLERNGQIIDLKSEPKIEMGDFLGLVGHRTDLIKNYEIVGAEVDDKDIINIVGEILKICVTKKEIAGKTLGELSKKYGHGCFLRGVYRQGHEMPLAKNLIINNCDVLEVTGPKKNVEQLVQYVGYPERATTTTDLIMVGWGCVLGTLLGLIAIPLLGIPITLGVGGGVLIAGLLCGWLRSVHPTFGQIPGGAQWIFTDLGLNLFICCVGLSAGTRAVHALQTTGPSIFLAGIVLTLTPMILGLIFGRLVLKINPVLLFGALTGAGTITAALNSLKEESDSSVPALGYTVPYAFGNVLLTVWGTLIVHLV